MFLGRDAIRQGCGFLHSCASPCALDMLWAGQDCLFHFLSGKAQFFKPNSGGNFA